MIDLYSSATPNGRKISIMLEELGVQYNAIHIDLEKKEQFSNFFSKISPTNKIPVIVDNDEGKKLKNKNTTLKKLILAGKKAIEIDGADVLILGCMSMAFHDVTSTLENKLKVPVINPVKASLLMAESIVKMNISHSKLAYPTPPDKIIY